MILCTNANLYSTSHLLCKNLIYIDTHAFTNKPILNMWLTQWNIQIHRDLQHNLIMLLTHATLVVTWNYQEVIHAF